MTLPDYTRTVLSEGIDPLTQPERLARHFAKATGLAAPLANHQLPDLLRTMGCSLQYRASLGRDHPAIFSPDGNGSFFVCVKRHRPCPRVSFLIGHEIGHIINFVARRERGLAEPTGADKRLEELAVSRFSAELLSPMEDFWPRFRASGLSIAEMVRYFNQSEHVVARQARLVALSVCPLMIFICPVVSPSDNDVLRSLARGVATKMVQVFDKQCSGVFREYYTAGFTYDMPSRLDFLSTAPELNRGLVEGRPVWAKRIRQGDLYQSYDLSAYTEMKVNKRKNVPELLTTVVRAEDSHYFLERAKRENALLYAEARSVFGSFRLSKRLYDRHARMLMNGQRPDGQRSYVQLTLESAMEARKAPALQPDHLLPLYGLDATEAEARLRAAIQGLGS